MLFVEPDVLLRVDVTVKVVVPTNEMSVVVTEIVRLLRVIQLRFDGLIVRVSVWVQPLGL